MVGSAGHARAREFLRERLTGLGLPPYRGNGHELPYHEGGQDFFNLAALLPGTDRSARPILLGAHYDSVIPAPCADDNAAAVAICLAVAEALRQAPQPPARDVLLVFFDAEEPPYFLSEQMGSVRFVLDQMDARGVSLAIIQDLTGHEVLLPVPNLPGVNLPLPRLKDLLFVMGAESHPALAPLVAACPRPARLPLVATLNRNVGDLSDHHIFRRLGLPYLFFSCGHWPHYHRPTDTPERLAYGKMARIAEFLTGLTLAAAGGATAAELGRPAGREESDTAAFECGLMREAFGPVLLPLLLRTLGLPGTLETRAHLDTVVGRLTRAGL